MVIRDEACRRVRVVVAPAAALALCSCLRLSPLSQQGPPDSPFRDAMLPRDVVSLRSSSYDRTGGNADTSILKPGQVVTALEVQGPGCVRHVYATYIVGQEAARAELFRNVLIRAWWDGEANPSVECPLGDFFGVVNARPRAILSLGLTVTPGASTEGPDWSWGLNSYFPMPFREAARIEITNESAIELAVWWHVDYERYAEVPGWLARAGRFHAQFRRQTPEPYTEDHGLNLDGAQNYVILDARGSGALAGYTQGVDNRLGGWWGEGDDMVFVDGEAWPPSCHGTGTEEIFGGGACPDQEFATPYSGFHLVENAHGDRWLGRNGMYRLFVNDPIRFRSSLRVTVEHGHANDRGNDYCSVAYWYQAEPHAAFPPLPDAEARRPLPPPAPPPAVPGAVEGEDLAEGAVTSGDGLHAIYYAGPDWSRRRWLWYVGNAPGDFFEVFVPVPKAGRYDVIAQMVRASDFGQVQVSVAGRKLGAPVNGYNGEGGVGLTHVMATGPIHLGQVELPQGKVPFRFDLVGKDPKAISYMVGLDYILLTPVGSPP